MGASTIVVAREDLSIPGAGGGGPDSAATADTEAYFFNVLREHQPDVVVLDLRGAREGGIAAILKVRRGSPVPIVVVCEAGDSHTREYCLAGAAECMPAPVDIMLLNQTVQKIIQLATGAPPAAAPSAETGLLQTVAFADLTFYPHENLLVAPTGVRAKLTTSENRVLLHFVTNPWTLCTRDAIAEALYGPHRPNSDRAVDVIVTRLRKKIAELAGPAAQRLIKTEFRRGYMFVSDAVYDAPAAGREAGAGRRVRTA